MLIEDQPKNPTPAPPPSSDFGWTNTESSQPFSFPLRSFTMSSGSTQGLPRGVCSLTKKQRREKEEEKRRKKEGKGGKGEQSSRD